MKDTGFEMCQPIRGAGHWVQQEQSEEVNKLLIAFLQQKGGQ